MKWFSAFDLAGQAMSMTGAANGIGLPITDGLTGTWCNGDSARYERRAICRTGVSLKDQIPKL